MKYRTLGNIGLEFYTNIELLFTSNSRSDFESISFKRLQELIDDTQYKFDLKQNASIAHIITKQLPIFERDGYGLYSVSQIFENYIQYWTGYNNFMKERFFAFCFKESKTESFRTYCIELYNCSKIINKTINVIVIKDYVRLIEQRLYNKKYFYRKLLIDLGVILEIDKGNIVCKLIKFTSIINHLDIALKIITNYMDHQIYKELDLRPACKLLELFGFSNTRQMLQDLRDKEKIMIRCIRTGCYIDFG